MIEREVTDLIGISFGGFLIAIVFSQTNYEFSDYAILIIGLLTVILTGFVHIIFYQLHYISKQGSIIFSLISSIGVAFSIIGILVYGLDDTNGFWRDIPSGFSLMLLIGTFSIVSANLLSYNAKPAPR